jgi:hypothetical protein
MTNSLAVYEQMNALSSAADALYKSGYFTDVKSQAQAMVKVMAGAEIGLPPFASMTGIHVVQGKPVIGSNLIATMVKNDPRYDYRVKQADSEACVIQWYEGGKLVGESSFTMAEAKAGNIDKSWDKEKNAWKDKPTWKAYPSDMLFARALTRGARRFAPGIFGGAPIYTPDEIGVETDEDGQIVQGEIINVTPSEPPTRPAPANGNGATQPAAPKVEQPAVNAGDLTGAEDDIYKANDFVNVAAAHLGVSAQDVRVGMNRLNITAPRTGEQRVEAYRRLHKALIGEPDETDEMVEARTPDLTGGDYIPAQAALVLEDIDVQKAALKTAQGTMN